MASVAYMALHVQFAGSLTVCSITVVEESTSTDIQPRIKATVARNIRNNRELNVLAQAVSIPERDFDNIKSNSSDLGEKAGLVITWWIQDNGRRASFDRLRQLLLESNLVHLLEPTDSTALGVTETTTLDDDDTALLEAYLRFVIDSTKYVDMIGPASSSRKHQLLLDRVYVGLRIDRTVGYEREQRAEQVDNEMKKFLSSKGISWEQLHPEEKVRLTNVYLSELPLSSAHPFVTVEDAEDEKDEDDEEDCVIPIAKAFLENETLVILGDPGSGKTTMVRWLVLKLANALLNKIQNVMVPSDQVWVTPPHAYDDNKPFEMGPARLPIFVRIARFANFIAKFEVNSVQLKHALLEFLGTCYHDSCLVRDNGGKVTELFGDRLHNLMKDRLVSGRAALILDGLDEVTTAGVRLRVLQCVETVMKECSLQSDASCHNQIIITSRIAGYKPAEFPPVAHGIVQRMDTRAIEKFIECWMTAHYCEEVSDQSPDVQVSQKAMQAATKLKRLIFDRHNPAVYMLASNPLLLTVIAMMFVVRNELPQQRARLYNNVTDYLLRIWRRETATVSEFDETLFRYSLEQTAFYMHSTFSDGCIRKGDLIEHLMSGCRDMALKAGAQWQNGETSCLVDMVSTLQLSGGLIIEKAPDIFSFIHLSFQEFLAGCSLLRSRKETVSKIVERLKEPRWRESTLLALGYASITWSRPDFSNLLISLLKESDSQYTGIVPVSSLLVVKALTEVEPCSVDNTVMECLVDILLTTYNVQLKSRCQTPRRLVTATLRKLCGYTDYKRQLVSVLESWLSSDCTYKQCTVALLTAELNLMSSRLEQELCEKTQNDMPDFGMPFHSCLRRAASPDVAQFFQIRTVAADFSSVVDGLIESLESDESEDTAYVSKELKDIRETYESSSKLFQSSRQAFFDLDGKFHDLLGGIKRLSVKESSFGHPVILPTSAEEEIVCSSFVEAAIASSINLFRDVSLETSDLQSNPGTTALIAAAEIVGCCVQDDESGDKSYSDTDHVEVIDEVNSFITLLMLKLFAFIPLREDVTCRTVTKKLKKVTLLLASTGVKLKRICDILLAWLGTTLATYSVVACAKLRSARISSGGTNGSFSALSQKETCQVEQSCLDVDYPVRIARVIRNEIRLSLVAMVVDGLKDVTQVAPNEFRRIQTAMNALYNALELSNMCDEIVIVQRKLEAANNTVVQQNKIQASCRSQLSRHQLCVHPARRMLLGSYSINEDASFVARLHTSPVMFKQICEDPALYRSFIALYGGISNLGYTATLDRVQRALAFDKLQKGVQLQISELQAPSMSNRVIREQFHKERSSRSSLIKQSKLTGSVLPILRKEYTYRQSTSLDNLLLRVLRPTDRTKVATTPARTLLIEVAKIVDSDNATVSELCDAAKCICASGEVDVVVRYLERNGPFSVQVATSLAESLQAYSEPACRVLHQLISSEGLNAILLKRETSAESLKVLLTLSAELGGAVHFEQLSRLLELPVSPDTKALLEAEQLATVICCGEEVRAFPKASWNGNDGQERDGKTSDAAVMAMLTLSEAPGVCWWGRVRWLTVRRHRFSSMVWSHEHLYTMDLLFSLLAISRKMPERCGAFLQSVEPADTTSEYHVLWEAFRCAVLTNAVQAIKWRDLPSMWKYLDKKVDSIQASFIRGQIVLVMLLVCPRKREGLLQKAMSVCDELVQRDASESSQLLFWTLLLLPASDWQSVIEKLEKHVSLIANPLKKGKMLALLSSFVTRSKRTPLLLNSMESFSQCKVDKELATTLRDIRHFVASYSNSGVRQMYENVLEILPADLLSYAKDMTTIAIEQLKTAFKHPRSHDVLLLAARLRDTLSESRACFTLSDEILLWHAVGSNNEQIRRFAKRKLKKKTMSGYLDLSCYATLKLETMVLEEPDSFALEILPYVRIVEIETIWILKKWLRDDAVSQVVFDSQSGAQVKDLVHLLLAEEEGLNINNTDSVILLLKSGKDVCRRRAEELLDDKSRPYYTYFVDFKWLYYISSKFTDLSNDGDVRSNVVLWVFDQVYHNDVDTYATILNRPAELEERTIITWVHAVDREVGHLLLDSLADSKTGSVLY